MQLCSDLHKHSLQQLAARVQMHVQPVPQKQSIAGSYWGDSEAGLVGATLYVRDDTPVHSALHELCHYVCMPAIVRQQLHTNAGGDYAEENGVCFLQIVLADYVQPMGREQMLQDMDQWGYTFRLGSAKRWFEQDAQDAQAWLLEHDLITRLNQPTWKLREALRVPA